MKVGSRQCSGFKGVWLKFGVPGLAQAGLCTSGPRTKAKEVIVGVGAGGR